MWIKGSELHPVDQRHALASFVHRYTLEHRPSWRNSVGPDSSSSLQPQFASDQDWLRNSYFAVRKNGRMDMRVKHCHSHPTWPTVWSAVLQWLNGADDRLEARKAAGHQ